eukprot:m.479553 g.479553  ORF g.479553 m.479553 type:complete len:64 (+) comp21503_c0_seq1:410-601(+)
MVKLHPQTRETLETLAEVAQTTFHWTFVPLVLYLGLKTGPNPAPWISLLVSAAEEMAPPAPGQ